MSNRLNDALKRLFPGDFQELVPVERKWWQTIDWGQLASGWKLWVIGALVVIQLMMSVHYFNRFVAYEAQVLTDKAQIEAQLQRRKDLIINLTKTVVDYAEHERKMFVYMADIRANSLKQGKENSLTEKLGEGNELNIDKASLTDESILALEKFEKGQWDGSLAKLLALAENYPELKLSNNFRTLMDALVNIEDKIVERRIKYNISCNIYGTYIRKFPQNVFAFAFRFKKHPFAQVDEDAGEVDRIQY